MSCSNYKNKNSPGLETEQLKSKANELWETVIRLETEKYDLEERGKRQGHDVRDSIEIE